MNGASNTIRLLGYAGLIPFVMLALLAASGSEYAASSASLANAYAFGIICFLCGSWWGLALNSGSVKILWVSNLYFLIALLFYLLAPHWWPLVAAILMLAILLAEQYSTLLPGFAISYRRLRFLLTLVAGASMLTIHINA